MSTIPPKEPVPTDDPNLTLAVNRLRRTQFVWAILFGGMAVLAFISLRSAYPLAFLPWLIGATLLLVRIEPIYLAVVAVQWGISLITLIPGVSLLIGPDPLSFVFDSGLLEVLVLVGMRAIFVFTSFNQFLFYRLLYGSAEMSGVDEDLPPIPEVLPNRSNFYAGLARALGLFGMFLSILAATLLGGQWTNVALGVAITSGTYAMGFGLGSSFSPTERRNVALSGIGFGALGILMALILGRLL